MLKDALFVWLHERQVCSVEFGPRLDNVVKTAVCWNPNVFVVSLQPLCYLRPEAVRNPCRRFDCYAWISESSPVLIPQLGSMTHRGERVRIRVWQAGCILSRFAFTRNSWETIALLTNQVRELLFTKISRTLVQILSEMVVFRWLMRRSRELMMIVWDDPAFSKHRLIDSNSVFPLWSATNLTAGSLVWFRRSHEFEGLT